MLCRNLFFFPSRILRAQWADRREILHDARKYVRFHNPGPKFWGCLPVSVFRRQVRVRDIFCYRAEFIAERREKYCNGV